MHARTHMHVHTHTCTHAHACIHAGTHTRIHMIQAHTHTCMHAHTHTHYQVLRLCSWPNRWLATPFSIYLIQISNPFCCTQVKWRAVLVNVKDSNPTENMHVFLCQRFLHVAGQTPNKTVYGEPGQHPLQVKWLLYQNNENTGSACWGWSLSACQTKLTTCWWISTVTVNAMGLRHGCWWTWAGCGWPWADCFRGFNNPALKLPSKEAKHLMRVKTGPGKLWLHSYPQWYFHTSAFIAATWRRWSHARLVLVLSKSNHAQEIPKWWSLIHVCIHCLLYPCLFALQPVGEKGHAEVLLVWWCLKHAHELLVWCYSKHAQELLLW